MDDPLSALAKHKNKKNQGNSDDILNEMEDLDNRVIPHNGNPNQSNQAHPKSHYRSISHNITNFSPSKFASATFAHFTGQQRKQPNHVFPNQNITFNNTNNNINTNVNHGNDSNQQLLNSTSNSTNVNHSPQPLMPDEDGDIANLSIFAMDHRITHNFDEMTDGKYFDHDTHTLDLSKSLHIDLMMHDKVSHRGRLHNECIMTHVQCYFVQYNVDTKQDRVIAGELYLSNYLLYFEPQNSNDVPGGPAHLVVPIHAIGKVSDNQAKYRRDNSTFELELTTRDYRVLRFRFGMPDRASSYSYPAEKVQQMLKLLAFPNEVIHMYAFHHCRSHPMAETIKKQNEEKLKYEKLRKLKKQDLIKTEIKRRQQLTKSRLKTNSLSTATTNNNKLTKPGKKKKKSKRKLKGRKQQPIKVTKDSQPVPVAVSLNSPTRDSSEDTPSNNTENNENNENNTNNNNKNDNSLQVTKDGTKEELSASGTPSPAPPSSDIEENNETNENNETTSTQASVASVAYDEDEESEDDGTETDASGTAPSLRSQGSIDIHNITMEMLDEKERLFLKSEIWGWHSYNVQKEFERMGIFMDDPNSYNNAQTATTQDIASLATPHHTFSDPAVSPTNPNNPNNNNNSNSSNGNRVDMTNNDPKLMGNGNDNNKNRPKIPSYGAPTPSIGGPVGPTNTAANGMQRSSMNFANAGLSRDVQAAADTLLNHGRSQTQADLQSLKRYRDQLADTRMGNTNYPRYRFTNANAYYELCETYTTLLVVPMAITDWELAQVSKFRRLGRIPVLTWKSKLNNVAMFRCSQPKVGLASNRSRFDEHLLKCIIDANNTIKDSKLYIMDARPRLNASLNKMKGAGFENVNFYKNVILEFLNVHNIHAMRKSRKALAQIIHQPRHKDKEWLSALDSTEWMTHIREILKGTLAIINVITLKQCSVLCHCSDGWDRTSQLCGLSQLCLDSYYRTIKGFITLIDKEWLSFGHQFGKRTGHGKDDAVEDDERSPVFEQFIECTYHLTQQFPTAFEFNDSFLIEIMQHVYDCRFGTFLFDCHKQRMDAKLDAETLSLWTYLQNCTHRSTFLNTFYVPTKEVLYPRFSAKVLKFWNNHYLKNCPQHVLSPEPMYNENTDIEDQFLRLKMEVEKLRERIRVMKSSRIVAEDELD